MYCVFATQNIQFFFHFLNNVHTCMLPELNYCFSTLTETHSRMYGNTLTVVQVLFVIFNAKGSNDKEHRTNVIVSFFMHGNDILARTRKCASNSRF